MEIIIKNRFLLIFLMVFVFSLISTVTARTDEKDPLLQEFRNLNEDIKIGNLLTGLYLNDEQIKKIIPLAKQAGEYKAAFEAKREAYAKKGIKVFNTLREEILKSGDPSETAKRNYHDLKAEYEKYEDAFKENMDRLNKDVQKILTSNQKIIVTEYKPCIIPVRSISNPERIGQVTNNGAIIKGFERVRGVPDGSYAEAKKKLLARITQKLKKHVAEKDIPAELQKIGTIIDQVKAMPEQDYELKKNDLAERILPEKKKEDPDEALKWKIDRFLLNPRFITVTEMKSKPDRAENKKGTSFR